LPMDLVNVVHPDRHPHTLVRRFVSMGSKRRSVRPLAAASLATPAKKYLCPPHPTRLPQNPVASPNPTASSNPTSQTTRNSRQYRTHSRSA
jgi:hypothetical protein